MKQTGHESPQVIRSQLSELSCISFSWSKIAEMPADDSAIYSNVTCLLSEH